MDVQRRRARLLASCVLIVLVSVPLILRIVPPNGIYGFRTSLTMSSAAIWYPANAFAGWALLLAAVAAGVLLTFLPVGHAVVVAVGQLPGAHPGRGDGFFRVPEALWLRGIRPPAC